MRGKEPTEPAEPSPPGADADEIGRAAWRMVLVDGHERLRRAQRIFRHLPSAPRCKLCHNPFGGVGGLLVGVAGFKPSRKNPNLCARCCDMLPPGGVELDLAVVFADVRGSTALGERMGARPFAEMLNHFYRTATEVLVRHDAIIDKLIGDEVMALFVPGIAGVAYRRRAAIAAVELVTALSQKLDLPVGAAVNAGVAYMGNVGGGHVVDFTAVGDPVNIAARLQAQASSGEVVVSDDVYNDVRDRFPDAEGRTLTIRGRESPVAVHVVRVPA
jgi:adenylate cyclase